MRSGALLAAEVLYKASALKDLKKLDRPAARRIVDRIDKDLAAQPRKDKALTGSYKGLFSYLVGDSRAAHRPPRGSISAGLTIQPGAAPATFQAISPEKSLDDCYSRCPVDQQVLPPAVYPTAGRHREAR